MAFFTVKALRRSLEKKERKKKTQSDPRPCTWECREEKKVNGLQVPEKGASC
jgi:hypothetical protein